MITRRNLLKAMTGLPAALLLPELQRITGKTRLEIQTSATVIFDRQDFIIRCTWPDPVRPENGPKTTEQIEREFRDRLFGRWDLNTISITGSK